MTVCPFVYESDIVASPDIPHSPDHGEDTGVGERALVCGLSAVEFLRVTGEPLQVLFLSCCSYLLLWIP